MLSIGTVEFRGWPNCVRLDNGDVEVIATTDFGPRVVSYRLSGKPNIFAELGPEMLVKSPWGDYPLWGGHRLWHAPEVPARTYCPDPGPVAVQMSAGDGVILTPPVEPPTGIEKAIRITIAPGGSRVAVVHALTNRGPWAVTLAPWAPTIVRGGGTTIVPNEQYIPESEKVLPARPVAFWHYADLSDPRWRFGRKYIRLSTDERREAQQKMGALVKQGWAAYLSRGTLFIKRFPFIEGAEYPDYGCNFETYTSGNFMEVESLGPLTTLAPGGSAVHTEHWYLFDGVDAGETEESLDAAVMLFVEQTEAPPDTGERPC